MSDDRLVRIETKLDSICETLTTHVERNKAVADVVIELKANTIEVKDRLGSIDCTLSVQAAQLSEHMRRSVANEEAVSILSRSFGVIKSRMDKIQGALGFIGILALLAAVATGVVDVLGYWKR